MPCESLSTISVAPPATAPSIAALTSSEHQLAADLVAGTAGGAALVPVDDAGDTFHVERHPDLHSQLLSGVGERG